MFHPSFNRLSAYADRDLPTRQRARLARHLASCVRCREIVTSIRRMSEEAGHVLERNPPVDTLQRILARQAAGERAILPVADPLPQPSKRGPVLAVATFIAVAAGVVFGLSSVRELSAERSELRFTPAEPEHGEEVSVEYRATAMFADEDRLVLRARYRTPADRAYNQGLVQVRVAELVRGKGGVFRGGIRLPDAVVYAAFAVEDTSGSRVDHNGHKLWELLTHVGRKPELQALIQQQNDLTGRNWHAAFEAARLATELHPDSAEAWGRLVAYESAVLRRSRGDSLRESHLATLTSLTERLARERPLLSNDIAWLYWFARVSIGDSSLTATWRARLLEEAPNHPLAVQEQTLELAAAHAANAASLLSELERLWVKVGPAHFQLPLQGYLAAERLADPGKLSRWAERRVAVEPWAVPDVAEDLVAVPSVREIGMAMLREQRGRLEEHSQERRALHHTVEQSPLHRGRARSEMLAVLGGALIEAGEIAAGIDTLELAAATAWDPRVFQAVAEARLASGDSARALETLARVAIDPVTDSASVISISSLAAGLLDADEWEHLQSEAHREMRERVLAAAISRQVGTEFVLRDSAENEVSLGDLVGGSVAMIAVWSPYCPPCLPEAQQLQRVVDRIREPGGRVMAIVSDAPSEDIRGLLGEVELDVPIYFDTANAVHLGLGSWIVPNYLVLDASGRVRFEGTDVKEALRRVHVLLEEPKMLLAANGPPGSPDQ